MFHWNNSIIFMLISVINVFIGITTKVSFSYIKSINMFLELATILSPSFK